MHKSMKAIINAAVRYEKLDKNRLVNINIHELSEKNYTLKTKTVESNDIKAFLSCCKKILTRQDYAMIYLALWGLRRGEVMGIKKKSIQFEETTKETIILINSSRTQYSPAGKTTKTPASVRTIILGTEGYDLLKYVLDKARQISADHNKIFNENDFVFLNPVSGKPWAITRLNELLKKVEQKTGFHIHPHMLRHTFATQAALSGIDRSKVQNFIGHKNMSMTDYYKYSTKEGKQKLVNIMDKKFN